MVATTLRPRRYRARYLECAIQGPTARQDADEAERARWIRALADMLKATRTSMGQALVHQHEAPRRRSYCIYPPFSRPRASSFPLVVGLEPPASGAGLKNTHQAYSLLEEMAGVPSEQRFYKLPVFPRVPPGVARLSPPWSSFEAGASFLGRSPHSPETSRGGPRHSSVLEDVCLVVASLSLGHAQG